MGGYGRHRTQFERHGIDGLVDELEMDIGRIGHRNLGRDDRCIADHGRESRLPYLDEQLVTFVNSLEINQKIRLDMRRGIGDKWLIRESLRRLEMPIALTELPKRAMQFGTKSI
jgi:asparagine synthetase B (glutamine-hydrolysing)